MDTKLDNSTMQLGDAVEHRGVAVAPLFPRTSPVLDYLTLDEALPLGLRVTELDAGASVPELDVVNPTDRHVLLYDGEELVGAKQNRILNVSVLVGPESRARIPVSCVEEGRWSMRSAAFADAKHAASPELRRRKGEQLDSDALARGTAQSAVWHEVRSKAERMGVSSPTGAQSDIFASRGAALEALKAAFPLVPGQSGAVLALGGRVVCLDYLSAPRAFRRLYPKLLSGYLLDALERLDGRTTAQQELEEFVARVADAPRRVGPSAALGEDVRVASDGVVGSGLAFEGELLQLCAFASDGVATRVGRIVSPSRRR